MANIFKKCFWKGHNGDTYVDKGHYTCSYCGTERYSDDTIGQKILAGLKGIGIILGIILVFVGVCLIFYSCLLPFNYFNCKTFANQNTLPFVYKFWYGCMINYQGHWVSPDSLIQLLK